MCGLTGLIDPRGAFTENLKQTAQAMVRTLHHRGPDDQGVWVEPECGLALAHARLSVLDLSAEGHQPMQSHSGRYLMVYNGEVYNFRALRKQLDQDSTEAIPWRGGSDTEVLLASIERWGLEDAVSRWIGMFALALWDRKERVLHLVRDRMGIKPLYYGKAGNVFLFGSELKALRACPDFKSSVRRESIALLLRHNCVPGPFSIYEDIFKLPPGHILTLSLGDIVSLPQPKPYWSALDAVRQGRNHPWSGSEKEAVEKLDRLLRDAVKIRLESDVPLGAFLSGGIDSSTVVSLMQQISEGPVKTFSIGFEDREYDEAPFAKAIANHLKTDHTELRVSNQDALDLIAHLPTIYDEPFADSSQIPTALVSRLARSQVTVALTGDGGDELFGGYAHYFWMKDLLSWNRRLPGPLRSAAAAGLTLLPVPLWDDLLSGFRPLIGRRFKMTRLGEKVHKLAHLLQQDDLVSLYRDLTSHWTYPERAVLNADAIPFPPGLGGPEGEFADAVQFLMYLDSVLYLPEDILTKIDRASMAQSLEVRVPLIDHRIYEFAWSLTGKMRIHGDQSKWLLRQVLYRYVPKKLIERPKMGFSIPLAAWLRGPLKEWAAALLDPVRLKREGYFNVQAVGTKWKEHLSGKREWSAPLWDVLMFQAWLESQDS